MLKRTIRTLAVSGATIMAAALVTLGATGASATTPTPDLAAITSLSTNHSAVITASSTSNCGPNGQCFQFINHDGLCLGITGGRDDAPAIQWPCNGHPDQTWHWVTTSNEYNALQNGDGECLGVTGGSTNYGAQLVGWTCNGHYDQLWQVSIYSTGGGNLWEIIKNYGSGLYVGITGGSTSTGAAVVQWGFQGAPNQLWSSP